MWESTSPIALIPKSLTPSVPLSLGKGEGEDKGYLGDTPRPPSEGVRPPLNSPVANFGIASEQSEEDYMADRVMEVKGPFTVIIAHRGEMIGLTDRIRLRPLTVSEKGPQLYPSSAEAAMRVEAS